MSTVVTSSYRAFDEVYKDLKPSKPLQHTEFSKMSDIVKQQCFQAQDLRLHDRRGLCQIRITCTVMHEVQSWPRLPPLLVLIDVCVLLVEIEKLEKLRNLYLMWMQKSTANMPIKVRPTAATICMVKDRSFLHEYLVVSQYTIYNRIKFVQKQQGICTYGESYN